MRGFIDLHCHWLAGIDDGARTVEESLQMLGGLARLGFGHVVATPHMRPGMFDNDRNGLSSTYSALLADLAAASTTLPKLDLASEHFFDDVVYRRLLAGEGLPYPGGRSVLVEFGQGLFPKNIEARLLDLSRKGLSPVLAHPERYEPVWKDIGSLEPLLDAGAFLLLDVCSLVGKYGRAAQKAAEKLLSEDAYDAACTDAHKPGDLPIVEKAIAELERLAGTSECERLFIRGPQEILVGRSGA